MLGASERDHGKAVRERGEMLLQFMRRPARGNEMQFVEIEASIGGAGNRKMAVVNGIEGSTKNRNPARMMFRGSAVRLRCGQCCSQESAAGLDSLQIAHDISNSLTKLLLRLQLPPGGQQPRARVVRLAARRGPDVEFCLRHRRWSELDLSHRHQRQRKWSGIQVCVACKNREELQAANDRWWRPAWWQRRSSVFR